MSNALNPKELTELVEGLNFKEKVDRSLRLIEEAHERYGKRLVV